MNETNFILSLIFCSLFETSHFRLTCKQNSILNDNRNIFFYFLSVAKKLFSLNNNFGLSHKLVEFLFAEIALSTSSCNVDGGSDNMSVVVDKKRNLSETAKMKGKSISSMTLFVEGNNNYLAVFRLTNNVDQPKALSFGEAHPCLPLTLYYYMN